MSKGYLIGFVPKRSARRGAVKPGARQERREDPPQRPRLLDSKPALPPLETPAGAPGCGFLIAYEDADAAEGWSAGVVRAVEEGWEGRDFTVETPRGARRVSRSMVFYWWEPDAPVDGRWT